MAELVLLAEDDAQEQFLSAFVARLAVEEGVVVKVRVRTAIGGLPRVLKALGQLARDVQGGLIAAPDLTQYC
jgi:hypothetical protein